MLIRSLDIYVGLGGVVTRVAGGKFGTGDAKLALEAIKSFGPMFWGIAFSISLFFLFSAAIGAVMGLVFYKLDKQKAVKDFVCAYANRLVLATLLLVMVLIISLILRTFSIATGIPAIVFGVVLFLNSMAGLTLAIGETNVGGSLKFYIYSAAIFIQMVVIAIFANWLMSGLNRF